MKFERLRLAGFKSFCDPTDFKIESGLTGVVGPNGCGKSNLLEALRWVMGESSYKNMRASGMDDVIFSGTGKRPSRNIAEVGLVLDNSDRRAPAAFNDAETIEVTRRIERESGSTYRVNGREVRARDVQLLFADASTGARSPAMVRQGQIGEIIAAKPQARRLILEEAAGVSGLHSRRHEAELRLKGAEDNLLRLEDVLKQIDAQVDSLKRQARQSTRYRNLAQDIRRHEALARLIAWREHEAQFAKAQHRLEEDVRAVAERTRAQGEAARLQAIAAAELPSLRDEEARLGAALHRLVLARDALAGEEKRAKDRVAELERRIAQLAQDLQREEALIADAAHVMTRLTDEDETLAAAAVKSGDAKREAEERRARLELRLAGAEAALAEAQAASADLNARRNALAAGLAEEARRLARFESECAAVERERAALQDSGADDGAFRAESAALESLGEALAEAEAQALAAEAAHVEAREAEARSRGPLAEAERAAHRLDTEVRTLTKLIGSTSGGPWPAVVDAVNVARGYEAALGAALGDDLDASTDAAAPAHWSHAEGDHADPELPPGVEPLASRVEAPRALRRRLRQIGVVARADGKRLAATLRPGQRLVSTEGDLWRWDGFVSTAEAPTPAARRLVEKNRLGDLSREAEAAQASGRSGQGAGDARAGRAARSGERRKRGSPARARSAKRLGRRARQARRDRAAPRADAFAPFRARRGAGARADIARRGVRTPGALRGGPQRSGPERRTGSRSGARARARRARARRLRRGEGRGADPGARSGSSRGATGRDRRRAALLGRAAGQGGGLYRRDRRAARLPRKPNSNRSPTRRRCFCNSGANCWGGSTRPRRRARPPPTRASPPRPRSPRPTAPRAPRSRRWARRAKRAPLPRKGSKARAWRARRCCARSPWNWTSSRPA